MDLDAIAEWSRFVVAMAVLMYLGSWIAFCAEAGVRSRLRRVPAVDAVTPEFAAVGESTRPTLPTSGGAAIGPDTPGDAADERTAESADALGRVGRMALMAATAVLALGVVMRAVGVGRMPWGNMYEFSITGALVAATVFIVLTRSPAIRSASVWGVLILFLTVGVAVTALYIAPGPLVPALRSYWLVVHVGAAVTAFGLFTIGAVVSALQIVAERAEQRGVTAGFAGSLPASSVLDRLAYRLTAVAFPIWTVGPLILGAVWAEVSWGRYWGWDPKEVWALITWLVFAAYLHARATAGWKGAKASVVSLIGYATVIFSYFGVNLIFNGLHSYGGL